MGPRWCGKHVRAPSPDPHDALADQLKESFTEDDNRSVRSSFSCKDELAARASFGSMRGSFRRSSSEDDSLRAPLEPK